MIKGTVLVTGGSRGIGRACVEKFVKEGYRVSFIYNNSEKEARALSEESGAYAIKADVSNPTAVKEAVADALSFMGSIDILVNNAGVSISGLINDISDGEYNKIVDTNLGGAFFTSREVSKGMISAHRGRIINVGSMWGKTGASCEVAYSASKAAIEGFTKALAKELGPSGICVNCIEPGVIDTDMNKNLSSDDMNCLKEETPMCRIGTAEETAEFIFLIATEKSGFLTGQVIGFDGGFAI